MPARAIVGCVLRGEDSQEIRLPLQKSELFKGCRGLRELEGSKPESEEKDGRKRGLNNRRRHGRVNFDSILHAVEKTESAHGDAFA